MTPPSMSEIEELVVRQARSLPYPATPDLSRAVRLSIRQAPAQRTRWVLRAAVLVVVLMLAIIAFVPEARALVAGWFRIGIIQIAPDAAEEASTASAAPSTATPMSAIPMPSANTELPTSLSGLSGITTMEKAEIGRGRPLPLPQYPPELGQPDVVIWQSDLEMLVLVWLDSADGSRVSLALYEFLTDNPIVRKAGPTILDETTVGPLRALWVEGPYPLRVSNGEFEWRQIVSGRSLLWERGGVTYRLESQLPLDEIRRIAESIP